MDLSEIFKEAHSTTPAVAPIVTPSVSTAEAAPAEEVDLSLFGASGPSDADLIAGGENVSMIPKLGARALNAAFLGKAPYLLAPLETLYEEGKDLFGVGDNQSPSENFSESVRLSNEALKNVGKEMPALSVASDVAGGAISPINKLKWIQQAYKAGGVGGILKRLATNMGIASITELGEDAQDVGGAAVDAGIMSTLLDAGGKIAGKGGQLATGTIKKLTGLNRADYNRAAKGVSKKALIEGQSKLDNAFDIIRKEEGLSMKELAGSNEDVVRGMADKAEKAIERRQTFVDEVIEVVEDVRSFKNDKGIKLQTPKVLAGLKALEFDPDAQKTFLEEANKVLKVINSKGTLTLTKLQDIKKKLNKFYNADPAAIEGRKAVTDDIRAAIENEIEALVKKGKIDKSFSGVVQKANRESRDLITARDAYATKIPGYQGDDALTGGQRALSSTGAAGALGAGQLAESLGQGSKFATMLSALGLYSGRVARPVAALIERVGTPMAELLSDPRTATALLQGISAADENAEEDVEVETTESPDEAEDIDLSSVFREAHGGADMEGVAAEDVSLFSDDPINAELLDAVRQVESGGGKYLYSPTGPVGPYQFTKKTGQAYGLETEADRLDEDKSRAAAEALLRDEYGALGDISLALLAYNQGRPEVLKAIERANSRELEDLKPFLTEEGANYVPLIYAAIEKLKKDQA